MSLIKKLRADTMYMFWYGSMLKKGHAPSAADESLFWRVRDRSIAKAGSMMNFTEEDVTFEPGKPFSERELVER